MPGAVGYLFFAVDELQLLDNRVDTTRVRQFVQQKVKRVNRFVQFENDGLKEKKTADILTAR